MHSLIELMRQHTDMSAEQAEQVAAVAKYRVYPKNAWIFTPASTCRHIYVLTKGLVRCFYLYDHKEINLRLLCEVSAVIAYSSYIEQSKNGEFVQTIEACEGYLFAREDIETLAQTIPAIERLNRQIAERHYLSMERRLLTIQFKTAEERLRYFNEHMEQGIVARTPAIHVASYLGMTPESLSRAKRNLNK